MEDVSYLSHTILNPAHHHEKDLLDFEEFIILYSCAILLGKLKVGKQLTRKTTLVKVIKNIKVPETRHTHLIFLFQTVFFIDIVKQLFQPHTTYIRMHED